jgi:hypothetical protein
MDSQSFKLQVNSCVLTPGRRVLSINPVTNPSETWQMATTVFPSSEWKTSSTCGDSMKTVLTLLVPNCIAGRTSAVIFALQCNQLRLGGFLADGFRHLQAIDHELPACEVADELLPNNVGLSGSQHHGVDAPFRNIADRNDSPAIARLKNIVFVRKRHDVQAGSVDGEMYCSAWRRRERPLALRPGVKTAPLDSERALPWMKAAGVAPPLNGTPAESTPDTHLCSTYAAQGVAVQAARPLSAAEVWWHRPYAPGHALARRQAPAPHLSGCTKFCRFSRPANQTAHPGERQECWRRPKTEPAVKIRSTPTPKTKNGP